MTVPDIISSGLVECRDFFMLVKDQLVPQERRILGLHLKAVLETTVRPSCYNWCLSHYSLRTKNTLVSWTLPENVKNISIGKQLASKGGNCLTVKNTSKVTGSW